ncbi:MAG TPA: PD-(D/E)XK nuclease family protein [Dehalococcoidia bacterium]|nr:PD-(D/E)XK nuclease family protein [Dehalococcoidia bacterium]
MLMMPIYSHSQLSMYQQCPLKYKLCYRDKIKRDTEGVEAFLGTTVHETLKKCYDDARLTRVNTLDELLAYYENIWQQNWHDAIIITKKDLGQEHYRALGRKLVESYYRRYAPFDADITIATEMMINFQLEDSRKHRLIGYIDRLARTGDDIYEIHDYKTSAHLPSQEDADNDRQLGLYQIGIQKRWPDIKNIRLIWHYLAFDRELVSSRSGEVISKLVTETSRLIDEIETTADFRPQESGRCEWCEYPDLCPLRKHFYQLEALPVNEYRREPGVVLVNKYAELKEKASEIDMEIGRVKEAILDYAREQQVEVIKGSDRKVRLRFDEKLKFPGKNDAGRQELDSTLIEAGKWPEVSQLDTALLARAIEGGQWDKGLIYEVMKHGRIETVSSIHISKLKDEVE